MAEGCCWYVVESAPNGCPHLPNDIVTLPCAEPCEPREVTDPGPCQGMRLYPIFTECQPCDGALTGATRAAADKARGGAKPSGKAKPLSAADLRGLRKVAP